MPRDAEAWLAERGVRHEPIRVRLPDGSSSDAAGPDTAGAEAPHPADLAATATSGDPSDGAEVTTMHARRLAAQAGDDAQTQERLGSARPVGGPSLDDDVATALAFIRRSTANAPQSVGRLRSKLQERDTPAPAIDLAIERAHAEGLVDDAAIVAAFVEERRRAGHAPARIRRDLLARGFGQEVVDAGLADADGQDLEAAAYDIAAQRADRLTGVAPETAVRRIVGHLARRGYPEGLARKVAREAVFTSRDQQRTAGH